MLNLLVASLKVQCGPQLTQIKCSPCILPACQGQQQWGRYCHCILVIRPMHQIIADSASTSMLGTLMYQVNLSESLTAPEELHSIDRLAGAVERHAVWQVSATEAYAFLLRPSLLGLRGTDWTRQVWSGGRLPPPAKPQEQVGIGEQQGQVAGGLVSAQHSLQGCRRLLSPFKGSGLCSLSLCLHIADVAARQAC